MLASRLTPQTVGDLPEWGSRSTGLMGFLWHETCSFPDVVMDNVVDNVLIWVPLLYSVGDEWNPRFHERILGGNLAVWCVHIIQIVWWCFFQQGL